MAGKDLLTGEDINRLILLGCIIGPEVTDQILRNGKVAVKVYKGGSDALQALSRQSVDDKLTRYLLNADHPVGGSKAKWFKEALGYTQSNMDDLAKQIVFDPTKAVQTGITEYGTKFNQSISITGANGKVIDVTFAWMKSAEDDVVRLVTSIPTKNKHIGGANAKRI